MILARDEPIDRELRAERLGRVDCGFWILDLEIDCESKGEIPLWRDNTTIGQNIKFLRVIREPID